MPLVSAGMPPGAARAASLADEKLPTDPALVTRHAAQRAPLHHPPAQEPRGPREHLAARRHGLAQRDRLHAGPRPLSRAHGVQRIGQLPAGLRRAVLPVARPQLRTGPERLHELRPDHVSAHAALAAAGTSSRRASRSWRTWPSRLGLEQAEIDSERQIILEEKRARSSPQQRVQDQIYERLAPESTFGRRLPIGTEETIKSVGREDFREYYSRWYVPSNMTVIVVGDADPAMVADLIRQHFGGGSRRPAADASRRGHQAHRRAPGDRRERLGADARRSLDRAGRAAAEPDRRRWRTARRELVERIGTWAFNRRMSAEIAAGRVSFLDASASIQDWSGTLRMSSVEASGRPGTWRAHAGGSGHGARASAAARLQRARGAGRARRADGGGGGGRPARGDTPGAGGAAPAQPGRLPPGSADVGGPDARRAPAPAARHHGPRGLGCLPRPTSIRAARIFIAELPASDDVPGEADLVALGRTAVAVTPDKPADVRAGGGASDHVAPRRLRGREPRRTPRAA